LGFTGFTELDLGPQGRYMKPLRATWRGYGSLQLLLQVASSPSSYNPSTIFNIRLEFDDMMKEYDLTGEFATVSKPKREVDRIQRQACVGAAVVKVAELTSATFALWLSVKDFIPKRFTS
jgi:hypothetical protein